MRGVSTKGPLTLILNEDITLSAQRNIEIHTAVSKYIMKTNRFLKNILNIPTRSIVMLYISNQYDFMLRVQTLLRMNLSRI